MPTDDFLDKKHTFAVVGASNNPDKWGFKVYKELKSNGFDIYPVNPKYNEIDSSPCFSDLTSLPKKPDVVITVIPPKVTEKIVRECKDLNIDKVWMQPGSESEISIDFCRSNGIIVIANACFVMDNRGRAGNEDGTDMGDQQAKSGKTKEESMNNIKTEVENCRKCGLWKTRTKPLVGDGSIHSGIMLVGESPGYYEDIQNKAFVGEAGKVLDMLLQAAGLKRDEIYITNVLKCHPPRNHNPTRQEIDACIGYLYRQIDTIRPRIIIPLGKYSTREIFIKFNLPFSSISELHGKIFDADADFGKVKIIPLYHPAVACYHDEMLGILEDDFKKLKGLTVE